MSPARTTHGRTSCSSRRGSGGELHLPPHEWAFIEQMDREHPDFTDDALAERRRVAERTFDTRGTLGRIVPLLEQTGHE